VIAQSSSGWQWIGHCVWVFDTEVWLVAVAVAPPYEDVRAYWLVEESPVMDATLAASARFRLGVTEPVLPGNEERRGPVGRVHDVMYMRGTIPDYRLPWLDGPLECELLLAFAPLLGDPSFDVAAPADLAIFLAAHRGKRLAEVENAL
jgi:hypothetical protein